MRHPLHEGWEWLVIVEGQKSDHLYSPQPIYNGGTFIQKTERSTDTVVGSRRNLKRIID